MDAGRGHNLQRVRASSLRVGEHMNMHRVQHTCCQCGAVLKDGKCLSCEHSQCADCPRFRTKVVLRLTRSQQMALLDILVAYCRLPDQSQEFVDVIEDVTTTTGELLTVVADLSEVETA